MDLKLQKIDGISSGHLIISGSKSESNRLLLLQALYPQISIQNSSDSDDSLFLKQALASKEQEINIGHAGTAMRFLTAYFSLQDKTIKLTGSERMKERPIKILVDALNSLGGSISYVEKEGFPPLLIKGNGLRGDSVSVSAQTSSQYITALMLIAPKLSNGLRIVLEGNPTSKPYIEMTAQLMRQLGFSVDFNQNVISIQQKVCIEEKEVTVESDWSSASYFFSIVALGSQNTKLKLTSFRGNSLQADRALVDIYQKLGVETSFDMENQTIILHKKTSPLIDILELDLSDTPDIAQTLVVSCLGLGLACHLSGLHTLKIKETDRLLALETEIRKLGAMITTTEDSLFLEKNTLYKGDKSDRNTSIIIDTYQDHRMAMAFAPLALRQSLIIREAEVVSKSYPKFWEDLQYLGFVSEEYQL